jgi:hypothetical protein
LGIEDLVREHRKVAKVARRGGDDALRIWYADLGVELQGEQVRYHCPHCGGAAARAVHEFVYCETSEGLICRTCRGDVEERAGALD